MNNEIYILIPSRIGSTRLKNKPLIKLKNKTLIQRVITNALKVTPNAYVATDSKQIKDNVNKISKNVIMTSSMHISGTDRVCEAANKLNLHENTFILNLQGDEPFIPISLIYQVVNDYKKNKCDVITVSTEITSNDQLNNPNCVLVETDGKNFALDFLRSGHIKNPKRHIGIYGYSLKTLKKLVDLNPTNNEKKLKLEQLRFLENNYSIYVSHYNNIIPNGIDTEDDVLMAKNYIKENENF